LKGSYNAIFGRVVRTNSVAATPRHVRVISLRTTIIYREWTLARWLRQGRLQRITRTIRRTPRATSSRDSSSYLSRKSVVRRGIIRIHYAICAGRPKTQTSSTLCWSSTGYRKLLSQPL